MNETELTAYILKTFDGVEAAHDSGNSFFFCDPENKIPFVTIVTSDAYDNFSDLAREGVFRLNIGIGKVTYRTMFPSEAPDAEEKGITRPDFNFAEIDQIMPHPVYGRMYWVCVLNPSPSTMETVRPLLAEAYEIAAEKHRRRTEKFPGKE